MNGSFIVPSGSDFSVVASSVLDVSTLDAAVLDASVLGAFWLVTLEVGVSVCAALSSQALRTKDRQRSKINSAI